MRITIHDVGHGLCISLAHENGNVMLWDCGSNELNRPSAFLPASGARRVSRLFLTNFDEDHVSDLPTVRSCLPIDIFHRNRTITPEQLRQLKLKGGPITRAMEETLLMMGNYNSPVSTPPEFPGVSFESFWASYGSDFNDTNNLSLVTSLTCAGTTFLIPGDLEAEGWRFHLRNEAFRKMLGNVNVLVASHHGREGGYCPETFAFCRPAVVVFSDSEVVHGTQETAAAYGKHASGVSVNGEQRYVLSTRNDHSLCWNL